jgi:dihydroflavonol-4-reductase
VRVLVTGATGLLGANVVRALLGAGHAVRAAVRASSRQLALTDLPVETSVLTLEEPESVAAAMAGCQAIVHAAAANWVGRSGRAWMERVNVQGTETVCRVALETGIRRMVHVSSVDTLGIRSLEHPADEECRSDLAHLRCPYIDTKRAAEDVVLGHVALGLPAVIVNPTFMLGPWDTRPTSGRMLLEIAKGRALLAPRGGNSFLDVRDAAIGVVAALERGRVGRRYILGGQNLTYLDAWRRIAPIVGGRGPLGTAPAVGAWLLGRAAGFWGRLRGQEPVVNPVSVAMGELPHYFSSARARAELNFPESDFERAVSDAWRWFREHGYAP